MSAGGRLSAVCAALKAAEPDLRALSVTSCGVFGSVARGDDRPGSDVDILIAWDLEQPVRWRPGAVQNALEDAIGGAIDYVVSPIKTPSLREAVERDLVHVF